MTEHTPTQGAFIDVSKAHKKPPRFIIPGLIPEGLTFVAGPPKQARKTTLVTAIAALVATYKCNALPREWQPEITGPVMVFSYEQDAGELRHLLEDGLGVDTTHLSDAILVCEKPWEYMLDTEEGQDQLMFWLNDRKPVMVVLDPLANFHSIDEKASSEMIKIMGPLRRWAKENQSAVVVVHHTRKLSDGAERAYNANDMRGTSALLGMCDGQLTITPGRQAGIVSIEAIFKRAPGWVKQVQVGAWENKGQGSERLTVVDELILKSIKCGYATLDDICRYMNASPKSIKPRVAFLFRNGHITKKGREYVCAASKSK